MKISIQLGASALVLPCVSVSAAKPQTLNLNMRYRKIMQSYQTLNVFISAVNL